MEANGINYYKGVLLCSRPNESPSINKKKEFCGRVHPHDQVGLMPVKMYDEHKTRKRVLPVLNSHKQWLEKFKKDVHQQKQQQQMKREKAAQRLEKIKQDGHDTREKKKLTSSLPPAPLSAPAEQPVRRQEPNLKKKEKPAWARTANQDEKTEEKEVDELLDFFNNGDQAELKDYISDGDVKTILTDLKIKIEKLKEQQDWRKQQLKKIEDDRQSVRSQKEDKDDVLSRISRQSGGQSVSSQKTAERVEQLQRKKQQAEWDKKTNPQKKTMASVDEQIAKHVADEVLRSYPHLKHHSNQSIRQLLQKQAHEQIKS